jgi:hypothetical protein
MVLLALASCRRWPQLLMLTGLLLVMKKKKLTL